MITITTELGKIEKAKFGFGGYQGVQIVFSFDLKLANGCSVTETFECGWGHISEEELLTDSSIKWTHGDRLATLAKKTWDVVKLLKAAKVDSLDKLAGIPIEATFDVTRRITGFRILTEVL